MGTCFGIVDLFQIFHISQLEIRPEGSWAGTRIFRGHRGTAIIGILTAVPRKLGNSAISPKPCQIRPNPSQACNPIISTTVQGVLQA